MGEFGLARLWCSDVLLLSRFSAVTRIGKAEKEAQGIAEKRSGMRGPENVWGSALVGAICAIATSYFFLPLGKSYLF